MKPLFFYAFLYLFCPFSYGEQIEITVENKSKIEQKNNYIDKSPKIHEKDEQNNSTDKSSISKSLDINEPTKKIKEDNTSNSSDIKIDTVDEKPDPVTKKIKKVFVDFLEILEKEPLDSKEYAKAVQFLENSLYNEASFETLKILATVYKEKNDFVNQIKVLNILTVNYSGNPESFYLLGMAHKYLYSNEKEEKKENKAKSIENFNQALKIKPKYILAWTALLDILTTENPKTKEKIHTKESLSVAMDMLRTFKKNKYYIQLCKAYYDNNFIKQSRKACIKSVKKNPNDPISPLVLALSRRNSKKTNKEILKVAKKFKQSFFVQYKTALFFMDKEPKVAIPYFDSAHSLQPENITLNQMMAKFFFENGEEEKSYTYFLNACILTDGQFLRDFRIAKRQLRRKNRKELILTFQKGIDKCFLAAKQKIKEKKNQKKNL